MVEADMPASRSWRWTNAMTPESERASAWLEAVKRVSDPCVVTHELPFGFEASIALRKADRFRVSDIVSDAFAGQQRSRNRSPQSGFFNVQLMEFGEKKLSSYGESIVQRQGDVVLNFGPPSCDFEVRETSRVITVAMPLARWKTWAPTTIRQSRYKLSADSPGAQLLATNFRSMSAAFLTGTLNDAQALTEAMIALLAAVLGNDEPAGTPLNAIKAFIADHIDDPGLSPKRIADGTRISIRHLHTLFEADTMTVQQFIISQRLIRCRKDLGNPCLSNRTIGEIAYGSGFQSLNHFCRRFKDTFGMTPTQYRTLSAESPGVRAH